MTLCGSDSSLTTTSHTMTACPLINMCPASSATSEPTLCEILAPHNRHLFLTPISAFTELSLGLAKSVLDRSAENLADAQLKMTRERREKKMRKRKGSRQDEDEQILKIRKIHIQGFAIENVWEQARRVIDALREDVDRNIRETEQNDITKNEGRVTNNSTSSIDDDDDDDQLSSVSLDAES
ncbi:putative u3 small nucleolar ribonucleoprotein mpp10 [Erysiphe neolycopersici]|uniref:Putative u3 small nucleolar ribonucleoprotein mpp10 n=1 Tax=Erysiphe neolycopersici TaxID=212602 RepID=A0A420HY03_9PEZI|nr:putative u3 small nucleolar ribonucleoprotein mpp10 [Erysiphe neolycopersici]